MFDDSELFDTDDIIVFSKNAIILQKHNSKQSFEELKKHLKELDGKWELDISDSNTKQINSWINNNEHFINSCFKDLQVKSLYSDVLCKINFNNLCDYLECCSKSNYIYDNHHWNVYEEYKLYGMKKPTINEWTAFHILELHRLYSTYTIYFKLGKIEDFIKFCFENSCTLRLPQY